MPLDAAQIAEIADRYAAALRALAVQWTESPDDLVQEAFCRLMGQRHSPERPGPWLFAVVRNLAREAHRGQQRRQQRERRAAADEGYEVNVGDRLDAAAIARQLDTLPDDLREVVVMRLWSDLTLEEIAAACGVSTATAHRRYQAALETLRERVKSCTNSQADSKPVSKPVSSTS